MASNLTNYQLKIISKFIFTLLIKTYIIYKLFEEGFKKICVDI